MFNSLNSRLCLNSFVRLSSQNHIRCHRKSLKHSSSGGKLQNDNENCEVTKVQNARLPNFKVNDFLWFDPTTLDSLTRREVVNLCKRFYIRAVGKKGKLIQDLKEFHKEILSDPSSVLHSPFIPGSISSLNVSSKSETSQNRCIDKFSGVFTPLSVSASSAMRKEELQQLCKTVGSRTASSGRIASTIDSLKANLGELDKSFMAETRNTRELFLGNKPNVSTILTLGKDKRRFIISKWKKKKIDEMGEEAFKKYFQESSRRGREFHTYLRNYFSGSHYSITDYTTKGCIQSISGVLNEISSVIATEKRLSHYSLGYTGCLDTLALYKGIPCVIEWKTSEKPKKSLQDCYDYPLQVAAYAGAINSSPYFSIPVTNGVIIVAYHDGSPADVHKMDMETCDYYWQNWLVYLHCYKQNLEVSNNQTLSKI